MFGNKGIVLYSLSLLILICLIALSETACNKEKLQTPSTRILGTWRLIQIATDDNNNGKLDIVEIQNVDTNDHELLKFISGNSGISHITYDTIATDYNFTWTIPIDDSLIRYYSGHDTVRSHIETLTNSQLTLRDYPAGTNPVGSWSIYTKQ